MRRNLIKNKASLLLLLALLVGGLTGCQNQKADTKSISQTDEAVIEETTENTETQENVEIEGEASAIEESETKPEKESSETDLKEKKESLRLKEEELNDTYWRATYYETFQIGEAEAYITEYDEDYYRFMDVLFSDDKTAEFRSIVGDNYESASGRAQWRITEKGDVILENMTPFDGMRYGYGFIPRFSLVASEAAPKHEEGLISLEYMEGCVYFKKMEKTDPFDGVDLANSDRLKHAIEQSKMNGQDITGEWVLLSGETDGNMWYALESGVECVLYIGDNYANYQYTDSTGYREEYYGMHMTYDNMALYTDIACDYAIYFHPDPYEYESRYEYLNFGMAPDGEFLIVQMTVSEIGQETPVQSYYRFQRGFG